MFTFLGCIGGNFSKERKATVRSTKPQTKEKEKKMKTGKKERNFAADIIMPKRKTKLFA